MVVITNELVQKKDYLGNAK